MRFRHPIHPGETLLEDFLLPKGLSQRALAAKLGWSPRKLNELLIGKRGITTDSAHELSYTLGTSMELWMYLQISWVLYSAAQRKAARRKPSMGPMLDPSACNDTDAIAAE
jgi:addiction module HigA family antidote